MIQTFLENFLKIDKMINELDDLTKTHKEWIHSGKSLPMLLSTPLETATGFWWPDLKRYIMLQKGVRSWKDPFHNGQFPLYLSDFLNNENGSKTVSDLMAHCHIMSRLHQSLQSNLVHSNSGTSKDHPSTSHPKRHLTRSW